MQITIGFELDSGMEETWLPILSAMMSGEDPSKAKKKRKPRKPMSEAEKKAFRKRMVDGQKGSCTPSTQEKVMTTMEPPEFYTERLFLIWRMGEDYGDKSDGNLQPQRN